MSSIHPTGAAVALFVDVSLPGESIQFAEEWRGTFEDFVIANEFEIGEAIEIGEALGRDGVHRMGGGAAPIFELRLATARA